GGATRAAARPPPCCAASPGRAGESRGGGSAVPPAGLRRWGRPGSPGCRGRAAGGRGGGGGGPVPCAPLSPRHFGGLLAVVPPCQGLRRPARGRRLGTALPLAAAAGFCPFCTPRSGAKLVAPLGCLVPRQKHTLPDLPYDYGALEPHINAEIMQLHHSKHHAAYVNNLNVAEEKYKEALAKGDVTAQVSLQPALKFNGGGHINHTIFWTNLSPNGGGEPKGELMEAIKRDFGSFANFKEKLTAVSVGVQGSGWGWLGYNKEQGRLQIAACANQDPLQGTTGQVFFLPLHFL
uniref:Superoxide dismutase [Mn], mitochondrial n=3 Tax=Anatinae TaxID=2068716 RepID=A0A8C3BC90_CAIMO